MFTRKQMKKAAKLNLKKDWQSAIGAAVLSFLPSLFISVIREILEVLGYIGTVDWEDFLNFTVQEPVKGGVPAVESSFSMLSLAVIILFMPVLQVGFSRFIMKLRGDLSPKAAETFAPYREGNWGNIIFVTLSVWVSIFFWSLLFIIPGIIKMLQYAFVPHILAADPSVSSSRAKQLSKMLMKNRLGELFALYLSFIGWFMLVAVITGAFNSLLSYMPLMVWHILAVIISGLLNYFYVQPYLQASVVEFYSCRRAELIYMGKLSPDELPSFGADWYSPYNPNGPYASAPQEFF